MSHLNNLDYTCMAVYFCVLIGLGLYLKKKASASLEDYFLGGRNLPWWALGISGMASWLDITGTMIIVSFLYILGPRGLYIEFRGGAVLVMVIMLLWTGKWHRRSQCMTGAEWMIYRFGDGPGGQFARVVSALAVIVSTVGMLAYMVKGVGLFLSMFLPLSPLTCALIMLTVATLYTMASGFYGVVFTDIFQSLIILTAVVTVSYLAISKVSNADALAALAGDVAHSEDWMNSWCNWRTSMPKGYEAYRHLAMFAIFYLLRNLFAGMGSGDDPKYFGARNDREVAKLSFVWTWLLMLRWPMMMAFAVLGLFAVKELFPDQVVISQAAILIKQHVGDIEPHRWPEVLSTIMHHPDQYPAELISTLQQTLGDEWATKLNLIGYEGDINPERILPAVILHSIPKGFRGLLLIALIAASMSTFDSTVNRAAGFFTRDIYQPYFRPHAANRELIAASWIFVIVVVAFGFLFGYTVRSINDVWGWIIMSLGGGLLVPMLLKFYWWRFNGGGFAIGTTVGMIGAIVQRAVLPDLDERWQFIILVVVGLVATLIGTYLTRPTERTVLEHFYRTTRPFGLWGPIKQTLDPHIRRAMVREHRYDLISVPFVLGWQITLFLWPMLLLIRNFKAFWITFAVFLTCLTGMYLFWYRKLPSSEVD